MTTDEMVVLFNKLNGNEVDESMQTVLDNLIKKVSELIITARNKDREFINSSNIGSNNQI